MKSDKIKIILPLALTAVIALFFYSSSSLNVDRSPSSDNKFISSEMLKKIGVKGYLDLIKNECCAPIMVETISTLEWIKEDDITVLRNYLLSTEKASAIISEHGSHPCIGDKFVSTQAHEAKHLLIAIEVGHYPISMCSTYDLETFEVD